MNDEEYDFILGYLAGAAAVGNGFAHRWYHEFVTATTAGIDRDTVARRLCAAVIGQRQAEAGFLREMVEAGVSAAAMAR